MGKILDTAQQWLQSEAWKYELLSEKSAIRSGVKGDAASYRLYFRSHEDNEQLTVYTVAPNFVPEAQRPAIAEFLTRANYGLIIGNFEFDLSDGEVRFKISVDVEGGELVTTMVKNMVGTSINMMDKYYPGVMAIVYGGKSVTDAIEAIEGE